MTKPKHWKSIAWIESIGGVADPAEFETYRTWTCGDVRFRLIASCASGEPWTVMVRRSANAFSSYGYGATAQTAMEQARRESEREAVMAQRALEAIRAVPQ